MGPAAAAAHAQQLNEDHRQAVILFGIVIIFLACNTPRVVLNFHEVIDAGNLYQSYQAIMILASVALVPSGITEGV